MEFDKYNVYSEFDRNEVRVGTYGVFADCVAELGHFIKEGHPCCKGYLYECIDNLYCFGYKSDPKDPDVEHFRYFYPLDEPKPEYRPFKDAKEAFEYLSRTDFILQKEEPKCYNRVLDLSSDSVCIAYGVTAYELSYKELLDLYIMTDGTPCGVREEKNYE